jgi:hypothetical protein
MSSSSAKADALIKEALRLHPSTRWLIYDRVARDFGEGFASVLKRQVEDRERRKATRTPRVQRSGGAHDGR